METYCLLIIQQFLGCRELGVRADDTSNSIVRDRLSSLAEVVLRKVELELDEVVCWRRGMRR